MTWTVEIGQAGGVLAEYASAYPTYFHKRLNALGMFSVEIPDLDGAAAPQREHVIRLIWNKGLASERLHFDGVIYDVRRIDGRNSYRVRGLDVPGLLWTMGSMTSSGGSRRWTAQTPLTILTSAGFPRGLIYNSQDALRVIGAGSLQVGSAASVPNKVDGANPGVALDFLASGDRSLQEIQRLCLQARYDGATYGLEFLGRLEGANNSDPRFYLVKRRERAAAYTPEVWEVNEALFHVRRGEEGITAASALRSIGQGDGASRIQGGLYGSGGLEGIVVDKSAASSAGLSNMMNRLGELLNPSTEVATAWHYDHRALSEVGDTVTLREAGRPDVNLRLFEVFYDFRSRGFRVTLGRPRVADTDPITRLDRMTGGQAHAPQFTDNTLLPKVVVVADTYVVAPTQAAGIKTTSIGTGVLTNDIEGVSIRFALTGADGDDYVWKITLLDPAGATIHTVGTGPIVDLRKAFDVSAYDLVDPNPDQLNLYYYISKADLQDGMTLDRVSVTVGTSDATAKPVTIGIKVTAEKKHQHNA